MINFISFSYKIGAPKEADKVFDARFLKNPFYEPQLSHLTGLDAEAAAFIDTDPRLASFCQAITTAVVYESKRPLTIAIGCTGGRHRSVHVAEKLTRFLRQNGYKVTVCHRDLKL